MAGGPKKLAAFADISSETAADAGASEIVGVALVQALAREVDAAFFASGGVNAPDSLATATTLIVDAIPTSGIDPYLDACAQMENDGATPTVIFINPLDWGVLAKIKETAGSAKPVLVTQTGPTNAPVRAVNGLPVEVSSGVPRGTAFVVDGTRTVAVVRQDGTVETDRSLGFRSDLTVVRVIGRFGFGYLYPSAVAHIKDVA